MTSEISVFIPIKPLSINRAWQGRRFKSPEYKKYSNDCMKLMIAQKMPPPPYEVSIVFGLSNKANDVDNGCKPMIDILQQKYGFNDRDIYKLHIEKRIVKKGEEFTSVIIKTII